MHPYTAQVHLINPSPAPAQASLISLDSQGERSTQQLSLGPGLSAAVEIPFLPTEAGLGWIQAKIQSDGLDADNSALAAYQCQAAAKVLLVGQRTDYGLLSFALAPTALGEQTGIVLEQCQAADLDRALQTHGPLLVAVTLSQVTNWPAETLRNYVESGGNLLILPTRRHRRETRTLPAWLQTELSPFKEVTADLAILERQAAFWTPLLSARSEGMVAGLNTSGFYPVQCTGTHHALLGVDYGNVVLAALDRGQGHVYICGMGLDGAWSNLPFSGLFVVMMHRMALWGSNALSQDVRQVQAGAALDDLPWDPALAQIVPLVGETVQTETARPLRFARSGVYSLQHDGRQYGIAVSCAAAEGQEAYIDASDLGTTQASRLQVVDLAQTMDFSRYHRAGTRGLELFVPLLCLATLVAVLEGLIAYPNGARRGLGGGLLEKLTGTETVSSVEGDG